MRDIGEIIIEHVRSLSQLSRLIEEKANGDWSKLHFLIENYNEAARLNNMIDDSQKDFIEATSLGQLFTYPQEYQALFEIMAQTSSDPSQKHTVESDLESARDMIADLMPDGEEDDRAKAIDRLTQLPNYAPDDWVRRKYMIQGIYLPPYATDTIPGYLIQRIEEASFSFIYGNFFASIALARATIEMALKEKVPEFRNLTLDEIVNRAWLNVKGLREHNDMRKITESVRIAGNQIMHRPQDRVVRIYNEFATRSILLSLKSLIEFLYRND